MSSTPQKLHSSKLKPPQTPTRLLLERIRRRSSINPSQVVHSQSQSVPHPHPHPLSQQQHHPEDNSLSLFPNQNSDETQDDSQQDGSEDDSHTPSSSPSKPKSEQQQQQDGDQSLSLDVPDDPAKEVEAIEAHFDQLLHHSTRYESEIKEQKEKNQEWKNKYLKLKRTNEDLQRNLREQTGGLTRDAAVKLDREFKSQELILKGLQRDNESKTIQVENMRRRMKIMSDHLSKQYGIDDWENVLGLSSTTTTNSSIGEDSNYGNLDSPNIINSFKDSEISKVLGYDSGNGNGNGDSNMSTSNFIPQKDSSFSPLKKALLNSTLPSPIKDSNSSNLVPSSGSSPKKSIFGQSFNGDSSIYGDAGDSSFMSASEGPNSSSINNNNHSNLINQSENQSQGFNNLINESSISSTFPSSNNLSDQNRATSLTPQKSIPNSNLNSTLDPKTIELNPKSISESVQAVRLLISAFGRQHALRSMELENLINKAVESGCIGEKRAKEGIRQDLKDGQLKV